MGLTRGSTLAGGKYRIDSLIGEGAFGRVFRAWDTGLNRWVAIKELRSETPAMGPNRFDEYAKRFRREAQVQAQFNHPHIVHAYELLRLDDAFYLIMEYADGPSLRETLGRRGRLPILEAVRLTLEVLEALAEVHDHPLDVLHRDIKPSNILLTAAGEAKLTDFGLAQVGQESARSMGGSERHPGTPVYMSPEQSETTGYLRASSDLYSVGCVLFEMLAGSPYKQAMRQGKRLRDLRPDTPKALAAIVQRAVRQQPEQRYQSAQEFWGELAQFQSSQKAAERSGSGAPRGRAWTLLRKHWYPWGWAVLAVPLAALILASRPLWRPSPAPGATIQVPAGIAEVTPSLPLPTHTPPLATPALGVPPPGPSLAPTATSAPRPTATPTVSPTASATPTQTLRPTSTRTATPTPTASRTRPPTMTPTPAPTRWAGYSHAWIEFEYPDSWQVEDKSESDKHAVLVKGPGSTPGGVCLFSEGPQGTGAPDWMLSSGFLMRQFRQQVDLDQYVGNLLGSGKVTNCVLGRDSAGEVAGCPCTQAELSCDIDGSTADGWLGMISPTHLDGYVFVYTCIGLRARWVEVGAGLTGMMDTLQLTRAQ